MRTQLQLELLRKLRQRKGQAKGFTLIELMIVVAILGLLVGVALPRYLGTRDAADAASKIGEAVGLAKECATFVTVGGVGVAPLGCTAGASATFSRSWTGSVAGLKCLTASADTTHRAATLTVSSAGVMTCTFG